MMMFSRASALSWLSTSDVDAASPISTARSRTDASSSITL